MILLKWQFLRLNALYMLLLWWEILFFLNALWKVLLKWELVCVWMRFIRYYWNENLYVSECALYDIIIMRAGICLNTLYMILLWWENVFAECALKVIIKMRGFVCLNALYMILLKWELVFVWKRFIWYYYDGRL